MSIWSFSLTDKTGKKTCDACSKNDPEFGPCESYWRIHEAFEAMQKHAEDPQLYPEAVGWGTIKVTCHGFDQAEVE